MAGDKTAMLIGRRATTAGVKYTRRLPSEAPGRTQEDQEDQEDQEEQEDQE